MKKAITMLVFMTIMLKAFAPMVKEEMYILAAEPLRIDYSDLILAIVAVEVGSCTDLYNEKENAVGYFQIRQIRVDHYNQLTGQSYQLADFYDYELSKEMFLYFAQGKTYEQAAKSWNGSGPMTETYWQKVLNQLITIKNNTQ